MNMRVDSTRSQNMPLSCKDFGSGTDNDSHAILNIRVARFANPRDTSVTYTDIGFNNAPVIKNKRVRYHQIDRF